MMLDPEELLLWAEEPHEFIRRCTGVVLAALGCITMCAVPDHVE